MDGLAKQVNGGGEAQSAALEAPPVSLNPELDATLDLMRKTEIAKPPAAVLAVDPNPSTVTVAQARAALAPLAVAVKAPQVPTESLPPLKYRVCIDDVDPTRARKCSEATDIGTPVRSGLLPGMDADGDGQIDILPSLGFGANVNSSNATDQETDPTYLSGPSFQWVVTKVPTAPALRKHVFAVVDIPSQVSPQPFRVMVGFDGRLSRLSDSSTLGFTLKNPATLLIGQVGFSVLLSHSNPAPNWALTLGAAGGRLDGPTVADNPVAASVQFTDSNQMTASYRGKFDFDFLQLPGQDKKLSIHYKASKVGAFVVSHERADGQFAKFSMKDVPAELSLVMNTTKKNMTWTSSEKWGGIFLDARVSDGSRMWDAGVSITGIPKLWTLDYAGKTVVWDAPDGIDSIGAYVTNHGSLTQLPGRAPTYQSSRVIALYESVSGNFDTSAQLLAIRHFGYEARDDGSFTATTKVGGGLPLDLYADLAYGPLRAVADINVDPIPPTLVISQVGPKMNITADRNVTLNAHVFAGWRAAIADADNPPLVHGLSVRDGWGCASDEQMVAGIARCGPAAKARIYLTGLPSGVVTDASTGEFKLVNYKPTISDLTIDVLLDSLRDSSGAAVPRAQLFLKQAGIPTTGVDLTFGPFSTYEDASSKRSSLSIYKITDTGTQNLRGLGALSILGRFGELEATLVLSNVPGQVKIDVHSSSTDVLAATQIDVKLLPRGIGSLKVRARHTASNCPLGDAFTACPAAAGFDLQQVPSDIVITAGTVRPDEATGTIPFFTYQADPNGAPAGENPNSLDINAFVDAALFGSPGTYAKVGVSFGITDLGKSTQMLVRDKKLELTSSPQTADITLRTFIDVNYATQIQPDCIPACDSAVHLAYRGGMQSVDQLRNLPFNFQFPTPVNVSVGLKVDDFGFRFTGLKALNLGLDMLAPISGDFSSFVLGWTRAALRYGVDADVDAVATIPLLGTMTRSLVSAHGSGVLPLHINWHIFSNHMGNWAQLVTPIPCSLSNSDKVTLSLDMLPHPHGFQTDRLTLSAPSADERAWYVLPDPTGVIPEFVANLVAVYLHPQGDIDFDVSCGSGPTPPIAFASDDDGDFDIYIANTDGSHVVQLTDNKTTDQSPSWSPDGRRIAFSSDRNGVSDLYLIRPDGSGLRRVTTGAIGYEPSWSPDGTRLAYSSYRANPAASACLFTACNTEINVTDLRGTTKQLTNNQDWDLEPKWSPDGTKIAFAHGGVIFKQVDDCFFMCEAEIYTVGPDGGAMTRLTDNKVLDWFPAWSPDGTAIAFSSMDSNGYLRLYKMDASGSGRQLIPTSPEGISPVYNKAGTQIAFSAIQPGDFDYDVGITSASGGSVSYVYDSVDTDYTPSWRPR